MERMREDANALYIAPPAYWKETNMEKVDTLSVKEEELQMAENNSWRRQRMTSDTIHELEMEFARQPKPSRSEIEHMAARFGQRENNIYAWFYRRRNREVREADSKSTDSADDEVVPVKRALQSSPLRARKERKNSRSCRFFSKEEQTVLENVFARQNYPGDSEIEGLARWFQKDERKVSAWFARRRLKFTKDFVKNIDVDSFVSPVPSCDATPDGSFETDTKYFNGEGMFQRPLSARYFPRAKDIKTSCEEDDEDEECDVERLSPSPSDKEHWKLSCLSCTPQTSTLPVSPKAEHDDYGEGVKQLNRETVIQWYPGPDKTEPPNRAKYTLKPPLIPKVGAPRTAVPYCCAPPAPKHRLEEMGPPGLLPIEWLLKFPQLFSLNSSLNRLPYYGTVPQWHMEPGVMLSPTQQIPTIPRANSALQNISYKTFRPNQIKTVIKKE